MTVFLDTSVLVPRFVKQATSPVITDWLAELAVPAVVNTLVIGEFASAISRLTRMKQIDRAFAEEILTGFDAWVLTSLDVVDVGPNDISLAAVFVRRFDLGLHMPDAIHAATCQRHDLILVTFDQAFARAAEALGTRATVPG